MIPRKRSRSKVPSISWGFDPDDPPGYPGSRCDDRSGFRGRLFSGFRDGRGRWRGHHGKTARILSPGVQEVYGGRLNEMGITFILVNQLKEKIGVMFGNPKTYIGKNPIDFHSAITLEMTSAGYYPPKCKGEDAKGIITRAFISKNKVAPPFARVEWTTWFASGIDVLFEQIEFLSSGGHLGGSPGWIEWEGKKIRKPELHEIVKCDPAAARRITNITRGIVKMKSINGQLVRLRWMILVLRYLKRLLRMMIFSGRRTTSFRSPSPSRFRKFTAK